jgi:hypothetical protein
MLDGCNIPECGGGIEVGPKEQVGEIISPAKVDAGFILFATDEQVRLMGQCSSLHMDGTFKTCPRPFAQVN